MNPEQQDAIQNAFCETLQQSAFLFADPISPDDPAPDPPGEAAQAEMRFSGPRNGSLRLILPLEICQEMAANMLGVDEDEIDQPQAFDAAGEMLNVLCGQVLACLYDSREVFDFSIPSVSVIEPMAWPTEDANNSKVMFFDCDDSPLMFQVTTSEQPS